MGKCFDIAGHAFCIPVLSETEQSVALIVALALIAGVAMSRRQIR